MKTGWIVGLATAWIIMFIFSLVCDQVWFNGSTLDTLNSLIHPSFPLSSIPVVGVVVGAVAVVWGFVQALFTVILLKFDFWSGSYMILWYIFCLPAGIGVIVALVLSVFRGVSSD
jgi:hypothetical protein